jgi:hypothetical protein
MTHLKLDDIELKSINDLKTGDIILCHSSGPGGSDDNGLDGTIEFFTHSPWEHAGIIIKNPWWLDKEGIYIFQSGSGPNNYEDVMNGNRCGVTLNHIDDFLANREFIFSRSLENFEFNRMTKKIFKQAFDIAHGKPYDKNWCSWIGTGLDSFFKCKCCSRITTPPTTKEFWCSALVAYMYVKMGWFEDSLDWSTQTPEDLASAIPVEPFHLSKIWQIK